MSLLKSRQTRFLWDLALNQENTAERDPGVPSRYHCLPHLLSQLRLQLLQGVPAQCPHAHALPYYVQLSSMTFKMMAESSGPNPDLLMQFIMNFWRGKQRIVYELTEITSLSMSIPPPPTPFLLFVAFKWQSMSHILGPMTNEVKYKTAMFPGRPRDALFIWHTFLVVWFQYCVWKIYRTHLFSQIGVYFLCEAGA